MLLAFDKYGKVIRQLTHGAPARQGSEDTFTISCYFKDTPVDNYDIVLISFQRPDGTYIEVQEALDFDSSYEFHREPEDDINTSPFVEGARYPVFQYTVTDPAIFNQYGMYRATILLYHEEVADEAILMSGVFQIPVQKSVYSGDTHITVDQFNTLIKMLSRKLNVEDGVKVIDSLPENNEFDQEFYKPKDIVFVRSENALYRLYGTIISGVKHLNGRKMGLNLSDLTIPSESDIILLNGEHLATQSYVETNGGRVKSVNGKEGHVVLNAEDVGAVTKEYVDNRINGVDFIIGLS